MTTSMHSNVHIKGTKANNEGREVPCTPHFLRFWGSL